MTGWRALPQNRRQYSMSQGITEVVDRAVVFIVGLTFLLPFVNPVHRLPIPTLDSELLAAALTSVGLVALATSRRSFALRWPLPTFLLLLCLVAGLHWATGHLVYSYSVTTLSLVVLALLAAYSLGCWIRQPNFFERGVLTISACVAFGAALSVAVMLLQMRDIRGLPDYLYFEMAPGSSSQPLANLGQPNQLAAYLALAIPATIFLASRIDRLGVAVVTNFVLAMGIAFSLSRMGAVLALLLCVWCLVVPWVVKRYGKVRWLLSSSILVGYLAGLFIGPMLSVGSTGAGTVAQRLFNAAYGDRVTMWSEAVRIAVANPWAGVGVGQYSEAQYWIAEKGFFAIGTPYAHNAIFQFGAEFGIATAVAFAALCGWWLLTNVRLRLTDSAQATIWTMVLLFLIHAMLEWSLWVLFVSVPIVILFAMGEPELERGNVQIHPRRVLAPVGLAGALYLALFYLDFDRVAEASGRLDFEQKSGQGTSLVAVMGVTANGTATFFKPYADRMLLSVTPIKAPIDDDLLERTKRVLSRSPDVETIAAHICALALRGEVSSALPHVERLRVFAVNQERYRKAEEQILQKIANEGERADPLRERLRAMRQLD
jgi:O-antigen ligase